MHLKVPSSFARNDDGNVSIVFGLALTVMFGIVGGGIDFARVHGIKSKAQSALDSATLAGGRTLQVANGDLTAAMQSAIQHYNELKPAGAGSSQPTFSFLENNTVLNGTLSLTISTPLLAVVGFPQLTLGLRSETVLAAGGNAGTNLEISLMLDTTGSMEGQKIDDLKDAAKDLVDIVVWDDQSQYTSKVALAPFSPRVNVGDFIQHVSDVHVTRSFSGNQKYGITCVTERTGSEAYTDAPPNAGNTMSAFTGDKGNAARDNEANYSATGECTVSRWGVTYTVPQIMPLSSDKTAIKSRIDSFPAAGATAGALGTAWAWYLLSPRWNSIWHGDSRPAPYADITTPGPLGAPKLMKVAVLMSDGIYNTFGGQNADSATVSAHATNLCNNMKAAGIKVYTVGFQLGADQLAIDTLKACASRGPNDPAESPSYFFNAASGDELRGAFRQIALQLATLRLRM